ncbi:hypothetical protein WJX73_005668 [Symbiochloris irregularis]|uniref:Uncharacterized protein n=1 Tax=Symbiochloris irregularis TaxID=706552 RepID=A0AAW1PDJ7_9CHLO
MAPSKPLALTPAHSAQPLIARPSPRAPPLLRSLYTRQPYESIKDIAGLLVGALVVYAVLFLAIGKPFQANAGPMWGLCLLWFCSHVGGWLATKCLLPASLGMVLAGFLLENIGTHPLQGLPLSWLLTFQVAGFAFALMQTSTVTAAMDHDRQQYLAIAALAWLPLLLETVMAALLFGLVFHMPALLAIAGGLVLSSVSPEAFLAGMLRLSHKGFGLASGVSVLTATSLGLASCTAAAFFAMFLGLSMPESGRRAVDGAQIPLSLALGGVGASVGALLCSCTLVWRSPLQRSLALIFCCQALIFLGWHFEVIGAGIVAVWLCAAGAVHLWKTAQPRMLSQPGTDEAQKLADLDEIAGRVWAVALQPLLFGCGGAAVLLSSLPRHTLAKALLQVGCGVLVRMAGTLLSLVGGSLSWREASFVAMSSIAKGGHQAMLGAVLLHTIIHRLQVPGAADAPQHLTWGRQVAGTSMLAIVIQAPFASLIMRLLGPRCLEQDAAAATRAQAFGSSPPAPGPRQANTPVRVPRRPAPAAPTQAPITSHSQEVLQPETPTSGNPFLDVELSTPKGSLAAGDTAKATKQRDALAQYQAKSSFKGSSNSSPSSPIGAMSPGQRRLASPRATDLEVAPDSYSALMTPTDSPLSRSRSEARQASGNPFAALGQAAGRILAGRFQAYKPLQPLSSTVDGRMEEGLGQRGQSFADHGSASFEVELMASPRRSSGTSGLTSEPAFRAEAQRQAGVNIIKQASGPPASYQAHVSALQEELAANPAADPRISFNDESAFEADPTAAGAIEFAVSQSFELREIDMHTEGQHDAGLIMQQQQQEQQEQQAFTPNEISGSPVWVHAANSLHGPEDGQLDVNIPGMGAVREQGPGMPAIQPNAAPRQISSASAQASHSASPPANPGKFVGRSPTRSTESAASHDTTPPSRLSVQGLDHDVMMP